MPDYFSLALEDRLARFLPVREERGKAFVRQRMADKGLEYRRRHRGNIRADFRRFNDVQRMTDRGDQHLRMQCVGIVVVDGDDLIDQPHAIGRNIIKPANERRNVSCSRLGRQQGLRCREAERDVDLGTGLRQCPAGFEAIPCKRDLDANVGRNGGQLFAFKNHGFRIGSRHFGTNRPLNQIADDFDRFQKIAASFGDERRVGRHAVQQARGFELLDFLNYSRVSEKLHRLPISCWMSAEKAIFTARFQFSSRCACDDRESRSHSNLMATSDATSTPRPTADAPLAATIAVLLPLPLTDAYDYKLPAGVAPEDARPGTFVRVPLGSRVVIGVIWGDGRGDVAPGKLREILEILPMPPLSDGLRKLVDWVAAYTLSRRGAVLRMAMSVPAAFEPPRMRTVYRNGSARPERLTPARQRVLDVVADDPPRSAADLAETAGVSPGVVKGLSDAGALEAVTVPDRAAFERPDPARAGPALSEPQAAAAAIFRDEVAAARFHTSVLDGVTGSGKTEVYFEAIAAALDAGRQALVLLPEIALSAQWLSRFETRFGARPAVWHSEIGQRMRRETWRAVAERRVPVVVGARSALWLPFPELGVIVVDEEHDAAYKQEEGIIYHARDMAVVRGRLEEIPVILASATPSLETVRNIEGGRYARLELPTRHGGATLPDIEAIDMRESQPPRGAWLSPPLRAALTATFEAGEQAALFLNRRGYAPLTLCRACGHRMECPNCSAWLVEHRFSGTLDCHHCGFVRPQPESCPQCEVEGKLAACGPGVERLAEEIAGLFPDIRCEIATSDTMTSPSTAQALIDRISNHEIDLVIGTQVIAKGHHFPMLTLVGVVDADLGLSGGDLRAAERTYQLLHQVSGRAGRAQHPGRVLLQTYMPDHPVMAALVSGGRDAFVAEEAAARAENDLPPFGRLAAFVVSGRYEDAVARAANQLARIARRDMAPDAGLIVLGPAPAPFALLRGRYRYRLLVKASRKARLQAHLKGWLSTLGEVPGVRVQTDVDPYSFL